MAKIVHFLKGLIIFLQLILNKVNLLQLHSIDAKATIKA